MADHDPIDIHDMIGDVLRSLPKDSERPRPPARLPDHVREWLQSHLMDIDAFLRVVEGYDEDLQVVPVEVATEHIENLRDSALDLLMRGFSKRKTQRHEALDRLLPVAEPPAVAPSAQPEPEKQEDAWLLRLSGKRRQPKRDPLDVDGARLKDIEQVLDALGIDYTVRGRQCTARCPLHEDATPSVAIDTARGLWYCFPCATGGDVIDLVRRTKKIEFADAVRFLQEV